MKLIIIIIIINTRSRLQVIIKRGGAQQIPKEDVSGVVDFAASKDDPICTTATTKSK